MQLTPVKPRLTSRLARLSLLLLAALLVCWLRSYWRGDMLIHAQPGRQSAIAVYAGRLLFETVGDDDIPIWSPAMWSTPLGRELGWTCDLNAIIDAHDVPFIDHPAGRARRFLGFAYTDIGSVGLATRRIVGLSIPLWSLALLLLIAPAGALRRARRRRWNQQHHRCPTCGYDLRATPERCPECGTDYRVEVTTRATPIP